MVCVILTDFKMNVMLSVNIPVYNIEAGELVLQLENQASFLKIDFEIRVYDDGSAEPVKQKNRELAKISNVVYREMEKNLGRAAIRNKMGLESEKPYLLFIDADSKLISEDYLKKYLELAKPDIVLCGGTAYSVNKPSAEKLLRWVYGHQREAISAEKRNSQKGFIITSNNFLIDRELFRKIHFRENIGPYGHEDTLLGFDLFNAGITPLHIDNPVEHTGLEDSETFLKKTKAALENLRFISKKVVGDSSEFDNQVRFLKQYRKITAGIPPFLLRWFFKLSHKRIEKNLTGKNPRLFWFDVYKLGYFAELKKFVKISVKK
jgi:glycosyltransferase involved in cell wall biosynthesis